MSDARQDARAVRADAEPVERREDSIPHGAPLVDSPYESTYKKLTSNLIGNSHMVPSGIVAVGHAQERGFPYVYCG